jgi:plastocyanin
MTSFWILTIAVLSNVVLASTTSLLEPFTISSTTVLRYELSSASKDAQSHNSYWAHWSQTSSSTLVMAPQTSTSQPQLHLPWLGNTSRSAMSTATVVPVTKIRAKVVVGKGGKLDFSPPSLNISRGSVIEFNFLGLNHTLTQSEFLNPCHSSGGFDSGFSQFNPANVSGKFVVEYMVTDEDPRWFFCAQTAKRSHCQAGMVFSLNPGGGQAQFLENALAAAASRPSTATVCHVLVSGTGAHQKSDFPQSTGTGSTGPAASSANISPSISNSGLSNRVSYVGLVVALVMM